MKKTIFALLMVLALLMSGCSGVEGVSEVSAVPAASEPQTDTVPVDVQLPDSRSEEAAAELPQQEETSSEVLLAVTELFCGYDDQIASFNENSGYHLSTVTLGQTELNLSLLAEDGPDLIDGYFHNLKGLAGKGYLQDLYPLMEQDGLFRENFVHFELLEQNGALYQAAMQFDVWSLLALHSEYDQYKTWDMDAFLDAVNSAASPQDVGGNFTFTNLLEQFLPSYIAQYVDYTAGTCDFDTVSFRKLLETAKALDFNDIDPVADGEEVFTDYATYFEKHPQRVCPVMLISPDAGNSLNSYRTLCEETEGLDTFLIGYPDHHGNGVQISFGDTVALSAQAGNQAGAWAFLKYVLTDAQEQMLEDVAPGDENGFFTNREMLERRLQRSVSTEMLTQTQADDLLSLIDGATETCNYDWLIEPIVVEEAQAYYEGTETLEGVVASIQSRCSSCLSN